jgi:hypothetical protein
VASLFTGQFKSELTCPQCTKTTRTFDVFNMVPVPVRRTAAAAASAAAAAAAAAEAVVGSGSAGMSSGRSAERKHCGSSGGSSGDSGTGERSSVYGGGGAGEDLPPLELTDALKLLSEAEKLAENDEYYCTECKKNVRATKTLQLWSAPTVLVLHLKVGLAHNALTH